MADGIDNWNIKVLHVAIHCLLKIFSKLYKNDQLQNSIAQFNLIFFCQKLKFLQCNYPFLYYLQHTYAKGTDSQLGHQQVIAGGSTFGLYAIAA
jgi:hypothetical protein